MAIAHSLLPRETAWGDMARENGPKSALSGKLMGMKVRANGCAPSSDALAFYWGTVYAKEQRDDKAQGVAGRAAAVGGRGALGAADGGRGGSWGIGVDLVVRLLFLFWYLLIVETPARSRWWTRLWSLIRPACPHRGDARSRISMPRSSGWHGGTRGRSRTRSCARRSRCRRLPTSRWPTSTVQSNKGRS